jgi:hypothetical protein
MKTQVAVNIANTLEALATLDTKHRLELSGLSRVKMARARREFAELAADFAQANHGLVCQYGQPIEGRSGEMEVKPKTKEWDAFFAEMTKLVQSEVPTVPQLWQITEAELAANLDKLGAHFGMQLVDQMFALGMVASGTEAR